MDYIARVHAELKALKAPEKKVGRRDCERDLSLAGLLECIWEQAYGPKEIFQPPLVWFLARVKGPNRMSGKSVCSGKMKRLFETPQESAFPALRKTLPPGKASGADIRQLGYPL
jgi:hypothetical protein